MNATTSINEDNQAEGLRTVSFTVIGDSMNNGKRKSFEHGDKLYCSEVDKYSLHVGKFHVLDIKGELKFRLISKYEDGILTASTLNKSYKSELIDIYDVDKAYEVKSMQPKDVVYVDIETK